MLIATLAGVFSGIPSQPTLSFLPEKWPITSITAWGQKDNVLWCMAPRC